MGLLCIDFLGNVDGRKIIKGLKWVGASDYSSFQDDLALLRPIAETCPKDGGDAVWLAQALYLNATNEIVEAENCTSVEERTNGKSETKQEGIVIFPNPATDVFTVTASEGVSGVEVYDYTGKKLLANFSNVEEQIAIISTKNLVSGIYIVKITTIEGTVMSRKVSILK